MSSLTPEQRAEIEILVYRMAERLLSETDGDRDLSHFVRGRREIAEAELKVLADARQVKAFNDAVRAKRNAEHSAANWAEAARVADPLFDNWMQEAEVRRLAQDSLSPRRGLLRRLFGRR
jgi:hypothetical protein